MNMFSRARAVGGSLEVTIPIEVVQAQGITAGDLLEIEVKKPRKSYFGAFAGVSSFIKDDELGTCV